MSAPADDRAPRALVLDTLPDAVVASMEVRDAWRNRVVESDEGLEFLVTDLASWPPGSTLRVAFLGGDSALHAKIADATRQITDACNIQLDFGRDAAGGFRTWHPGDTAYSAEIRVSFDQGGYFSLVGTDSTDGTIGSPGDPVGGRPGQRTLNLAGFPTVLPPDWQGTVRHEFLHALAFSHEHQNMRGPCEDDFRWEDDPGYLPTQDESGMFVRDASGRYPGIYTYLAGEPNRWPRAKVDHNLRTVEDPNFVPGPFDPESVMLYQFDGFFYRSSPSRCAPTGNGIDLSDGDKRGLQLLYPGQDPGLADVTSRAKDTFDRLGGADESAYELSPFEERVLELVRAKAGF